MNKRTEEEDVERAWAIVLMTVFAIVCVIAIAVYVLTGIR